MNIYQVNKDTYKLLHNIIPIVLGTNYLCKTIKIMPSICTTTRIDEKLFVNVTSSKKNNTMSSMREQIDESTLRRIDNKNCVMYPDDKSTTRGYIKY